MRKLKISASESLAKAVRKRPLCLDLVFRRQISPHYLGRMHSIVIEPRLCRLEVNDHFPQSMHHILDIGLMQVLLQTLLFIDLELEQRAKHGLHFFFSLRHNNNINQNP